MLPFFIGVVDREALRLTIYSGEYLPVLFSHEGRPARLTLCPASASEIDASGPYDTEPPRVCSLRLPRVLELAATDNDTAFQEGRQALSRLCSRVLANISSRTNSEYIFRVDDSGRVVIMAGPASVQTFRRNFLLRLAEVFYNLEWLLANRRGARRRKAKRSKAARG